MSMQVPAHYKTLVERHGESVEDAIEAGEVSVGERDHIPSRSALSFSLTPSEELALGWIAERFDIPIKDIRRDSSGIDFIYGNVGFEIKSGTYYKFSESQVDHAVQLDYLFLVKSKNDDVKIIDLYDQPRLQALR